MTNRWDERYLSGEYGPKDAEPLLVRYAAQMKPGAALDVACGLGRNSLWLARSRWNVTAVDYSQVALAQLEQERGDLPIRTILADIEGGEFAIAPQSYDLIVDCCFLYRPLFERMKAGLRPGGYFVGVFRMEAGRHCSNPEYLVKAGELQSFFLDWEVLHTAERKRAEIVARAR